MIAYDRAMCPEIMNLQGDVFYIASKKMPGLDEAWFISGYMRTRVRSLLDIGNFAYAYMSYSAILEIVLAEMNGSDTAHGDFTPVEYKRGNAVCDAMWIGMMYSYYQWRSGIASKELVERLALETMERIYPALHQMGWESAAHKIHSNVLMIGELEELQ